MYEKGSFYYIINASTRGGGGGEWFSDRRIWPWKAHGLWIFAVNRADSWILKTQWIMDQLWILVWITDCACLDVPKWNLDHRSFLGRYANEFIQIISFFERSSFKFRCETVIGIIPVIVIKHVAFFTICVK